MNNHHNLQELGISQIQVIHRFFDIKMEVLFAVLQPCDTAWLIDIQHAVGDVDRCLARLLTHLQPRTGEKKAQRALRLRGCNVLSREAADALHAAREKTGNLPYSLDMESYTTGEKEAIRDMAESLCAILDSDLYLLAGGGTHKR